MLRVRSAVPADVPDILALIGELADYERLAHEVFATQARLHDSLFEKQHAHVLMAQWEQRVVGFALYFFTYSTFLAQPSLYLEDLFVRPAARGQGIGKALMQQLAAEATRQGCGRFEWSVLDWNAPARRFYEGLGAVCKDDWRIYRVTGDALHSLAAGAEPIDSAAATKNRT